MASVTQVNVYPVKSCRGISVESAVVTPTGLLFDRNWVIVRDQNGKFITQRQKPQLALVEVSVVPEALLQGADLAGCPDAKLVLNAPGMPELQVPISASAAAGKKLVPTTVWEWSGVAADEGDAAAQWLSSYLGLPARLVRYAGQPGALGQPSQDPQRRAVDPEWAPLSGPPAETAFADGFPFLLANEASLEDLNAKMGAKGEPAIPMNRFRPNLVVAGAAAWEEDGWASVHIGSSGEGAGDGGITFDSVKPCSRCKVTTIDQASGEEGLEPLITLAEARSGRVLGWQEPAEFRGSVFFAANLVARQRGVVRRGDALVVAARLEGPPRPNPV